MPFRAWLLVIALGVALPSQAQEPEGIAGEGRNDQQSQSDRKRNAEEEPQSTPNPPRQSKAGIEGGVGTVPYEMISPEYPGYPECNYDTVEECDLLAQKAMAQSTWWMNSAAWVGVVLSTIGIGLIARTMGYTRDAAIHAKSAADAGWETVVQAKIATAATQEMLRTERAWLLFGYGQAMPWTDNPITDERVGFSFQLVFINMGRTPAIKVAIQSQMDVVSPGGFPKFQRTPISRDFDVHNASVGPNGTYSGDPQVIPFALLDAAIAGDVYVLGWARVYYEDIWGGEHETEVTFGVRPVYSRAAYNAPAKEISGVEMFNFHRWPWRNSAT